MNEASTDGRETVPLDAIRTAPAEVAPLESPARTQDPLTGQDARLAQHLGRIGGFVGGGPEKAGNIAYIVIITSVILLILSMIFTAYVQNDKLIQVFDRIVSGSIALITGALGYIFGDGGHSKRS